MSEPLFTKVDCLRLPVHDLDEALTFYRDQLGHELIWRTAEAVWLRLANAEAELVLHTEPDPSEVDLMVNSVEEAIVRFQEAGGVLVEGPFEIRIGKCAVVKDPWGNVLVLLDSTNVRLKTDSEGNVTGLS